MKNAIILHGKPGKAEYLDPSVPMPYVNHWLGWLQKQLSDKGIYTVNPEVSEPYDPQYDLWLDAVKGLRIDHQTTLVGHSCGAGFWLRYLSDNPQIAADKLILVAPWIDRTKRPEFFDFTIDPDLPKRVLGGIAIFNSLDDSKQIQKTVTEVVSALPPAELHELNGYGHFTFGTMQTNEFPELLQEIIA